MPYRALAVTTRRHPVAIATYLGLAILGALYVAGPASSAAMANEAGETWASIWQWSLLVGGLVAAVGALAPATRLLLGLKTEALGAMTLGVEMAAYSTIMATQLSAVPWASVTMFGAVAIGCLCRTWTAMRDHRRVMNALVSPKAATTLAEAEE